MKITEGRIEKKKFEKMDSIEYRGFTISFNPMWKAYKISPYHPELGANDDFKSIDDAIDFIDRAGYDFNPKWEKVNVQEKQLQERSDLTFDVVYVNAMDSVTVEINSKNYSDVNRIENDVMEQLLKRDPNAGDELIITIVATGFDESKQVYRQQQREQTQSEPVSTIRTFGFESDDSSDETLDSFDDEKEDEAIEDEEIATPKVPTPPEVQTDDPLDVPAFMRKR